MPLPAILETLLDRRLAALRRPIPHALAGEASGVHQARVATRRLRELLPVIGSTVGPRRLRKSVKRARRITRALGHVRELDVSLELAARLEKARPELRDALGATRELLRGQHDTRRAALVEALAPAKIERLAAAIDALRSRAEDDGLRWRRLLAARIARRAALLREAVDGAGVMYDPERLHLVRISAKKLRYALELADDTRAVATRRLVRQLVDAQDELGRLHDLQVLGRHVVEARADPGATSVRGADLESLGAALERQCRALHADFLPSRARVCKVADTALDRVVPRLTSPVAAASRRRVPGRAVA